MQRKRLLQLLILIFALFVLGGVLGIWSNFMWFSSLSYQRVFWTLFLTRFVVGAVVFLIFFAFFQANFWYLRRSLPPFQVIDINTRVYEVFIAPLRRIFSSKAGKLLTGGVSALFALFFAVSISTRWEVFQKFFWKSPFSPSHFIFSIICRIAVKLPLPPYYYTQGQQYQSLLKQN